MNSFAVSSHKKGVGFANDEGKFNRLSPEIDKLGCAWYYNWTPRPDSAHDKITADFVPMIWGANDCTPANLRQAERDAGKNLLGFNEPDRRDQSNLTVAQALELWPKLMATGRRLGSPAPSWPETWLPEFMREADKRGYRVDFICLHWYGDITDPDAVENLQKLLTKNWERYHKPIWLTEFSGSEGSWIKLNSPPMTEAKNAAFARKVIPMLEKLPFVERYAWFELKWKEKPWSHVALIDPETGQPTVIGEAYRSTK